MCVSETLVPRSHAYTTLCNYCTLGIIGSSLISPPQYLHLSHRWYTPCSSMHLRPLAPHRSYIDPGRIRSYTHHRYEPVCTDEHMSHTLHKDHRLEKISRNFKGNQYFWQKQLLNAYVFHTIFQWL